MKLLSYVFKQIATGAEFLHLYKINPILVLLFSKREDKLTQEEKNDILIYF